MGSKNETTQEEVASNDESESLDSLKVPDLESSDSEAASGEGENSDETSSSDNQADGSGDEKMADDQGESETDFSMLQRLEAEAKENYQKYLYAMAEIDNMKKRHIKERSELIKYNGEHVARDLLEVLDDLERTLEQGHEISSEVLFEGVTLITSRMRSIFERHQVRAQDAVGKPFDPSVHEALTMTPSNEAAPGTILHQLKKAYFFKDKLLRPAQVVVASEGDVAESADDEV
jgi:molecular chaperone GrpE